MCGSESCLDGSSLFASASQELCRTGRSCTLQVVIQVLLVIVTVSSAHPLAYANNYPSGRALRAC
jgi:hypothetical protein